MVNSRAISDLLPEAQTAFWQFAERCGQAGLHYLTDWVVISTYRDQEYQDALWESGRSNPGKIVTWTRNSRHTERRAFDVAVRQVGKIAWESPRYKDLADIGREMGLVVGYDFKHQDPGHYEVP
jgi:peptidoglycan L-alanyl-D-glutamate endopeptidase CwlK